MTSIASERGTRRATFPRNPWVVGAYPLGVFLLVLALRWARTPREPFDVPFAAGLLILCGAWAWFRARLTRLDVFDGGLQWRGRFLPWSDVAGAEGADRRGGRSAQLVLRSGRRLALGNDRRGVERLVAMVQERVGASSEGEP